MLLLFDLLPEPSAPLGVPIVWLLPCLAVLFAFVFLGLFIFMMKRKKDAKRDSD